MPQPRPEFENPPEVFYNAREAQRYTVSTRVRTIQRQMTLRALELMNLPQPTAETAGLNQSAYILDIGCGSGLSGAVLTEEGHAWVGVDISRDMLQIAKEDELQYYDVPLHQQGAPVEEEDFLKHRKKVDLSNVQWGLADSEPHSSAADEEDEEAEEAEPEGPLRRPSGPEMVEVAHSDMGQGLPFRPGTFDGCVSISAIQWLCHVSKKGEVPQRRLMALFQSLYNCLRRGAKAVLQFYPSTADQVHMITRAAMKCGFSGGVVVDFPNSSRAKKHYLVLQAGQVAGGFVPPPGLTGEVTDEDEEEEDEEDEEEDDDDEDDGEEARTQVRVAGRDRERVKRARAHSSHQQKNKRRRKDNRPVTGTKDWVLLKKDERRRRGEKVSSDSKYTMRRRKPRF